MRCSLLTLLAMLCGAQLYGQTPSLDPGTPLRVTARDFKVEGEFIRWEAGSLVIRPEGVGSGAEFRADRAVAVAEILRLERQAPRSRGRGAARGALWGGIVGVAVGAVSGASHPGGLTKVDGALFAAGVVGALGAGAGAIIGAALPGGRWEPVELEP